LRKNPASGTRAAEDSAAGIVFHFSHNGYFTEVAEVRAMPDSGVRARKIWVAGNVGIQIIKPSGTLSDVREL
jgi:isoquinoline 1-oxidoreductase subunit beta